MGNKPKGSDAAIASAKTALGNLKGALAADRKAGFTATQGQLGAIYGNLRTTQAGISQQLTGTQQRMLNGVERISERLGNLKTGEKAARTEYGVEVGRFFDPAQAQAQAGKLIGVSNLRAGLEAYRGVKEAGKVATASATEAAAGAQYALASALSQRTTADAATIAQQEFALAQMELEHDIRMEEMHEQYELDLKRMEAQADAEDPTGTKKGQILTLTQNTAVAFSELNQLFNTPNDEGKYMTAPEAAKAYIASAGITDTSEATLITSLARAMYSAGAGPDTAGQLFGPASSGGHDAAFRSRLVLTTVKTTLAGLYPGYAKYMDDITTSVDTWTAMATPFGAPPAGSGGGAPPPTSSQTQAAKKFFVDNPNASGGLWVKGNMENAKIPPGYHAIGDDGNLTQVLEN